MTHLILLIIQFVCLIVCSACLIRLQIELKVKGKLIQQLEAKVDAQKHIIEKRDILKKNEAMDCELKTISTLIQIQNNYAISKTNKIMLVVYASMFIENYCTNRAYTKINFRKFTYKEATDIIIKFIKSNKQDISKRQEVLDALYFLITK